MNNDSGSGAGRTVRRYKQQIHLQGEYGTTLVRRTDPPDVGFGKLGVVVAVDSTVEFDGDEYSGAVKVASGEIHSFIESAIESGADMRVYNFITPTGDD